MERIIRKETLTTVQRQNRLNFACKNINMDWSRVIFSGEFMVGPVGIWASIDYWGTCKIRFFNGSLSSAQYVSILEDIVSALRNENENMIFMHDAAKVHKSVLSRLWFANHPEVKFLDWPANSMNINPMRKLWELINERTEGVRPRNAQTIQPIIYRCCEDLRMEGDSFEITYNSLRGCMKLIIEKEGDFIE